MPLMRSWVEDGSRALAPHFDRLRQALDGLGARLREGLATSIGRVVAEAVHEAVHSLLGGEAEPRRYGPTDRWSQQPSPHPWNEPARGHHDPRYGQHHDPRYERQEGSRYGYWQDDEEEELDDERPYLPQQVPVSPRDRRPRWWAQAVTLGCQTAAWWLRRKSGPGTLLAAVGLGVAAALAVYLTGHLVLPAAALTSSAVGLMALSEWLSYLARLLR